MILLDTNVVSEVMRTSPDAGVLRWLNEQQPTMLHISSITIGEIVYGLEALDSGARKNALKSRFRQFLERGFHHRILTFTEEAAYRYGELMAHRREIGRPMSIADGQIASIAIEVGCALATRDAGGFVHIGLTLVNPWAAYP